MANFNFLGLLGGIIVIGLIGLFIYQIVYRSKNKEGYGFVMGAIKGKHDRLHQKYDNYDLRNYYSCVADCEQTDPSTFLGKNRGNLICQENCDRKFEIQKRRDLPPHSEPSISDKCTDVCGDGNTREERLCRDKCVCQDYVVEKCKQECVYAPYKTDLNICMKNCYDVTKVNCSTVSWNWK